MLLFLILVLMLLFGGGAVYGYSKGYYGSRAMSVLSILLVLMTVFLLMGRSFGGAGIYLR